MGGLPGVGSIPGTLVARGWWYGRQDGHAHGHAHAPVVRVTPAGVALAADPNILWGRPGEAGAQQLPTHLALASRRRLSLAHQSYPGSRLISSSILQCRPTPAGHPWARRLAPQEAHALSCRLHPRLSCHHAVGLGALRAASPVVVDIVVWHDAEPGQHLGIGLHQLHLHPQTTGVLFHRVKPCPSTMQPCGAAPSCEPLRAGGLAQVQLQLHLHLQLEQHPLGCTPAGLWVLRRAGRSALPLLLRAGLTSVTTPVPLPLRRALAARSSA